MKRPAEPSKRRTIQDTLNRLYLLNKRAPEWAFWALIILYMATTAFVSTSAGSQAELKIGGAYVPFYTFAGVFSSVANLWVIVLAVYYEKRGFVAALVLLLVQLPMILVGVVVRHNYTSLPGVFQNLITILAVIFFYLGNARIEKYQRTLRDQAVLDMLTGLPNWFAVTELIEALVHRGERFAVCSVDLNGFKSINDTMGYETGNAVLVEIAKRWKAIADSKQAGTMDFIARLSGDEFSLVIRDFSSEEELARTIEMYDRALEDQMSIMGYDLFISGSFGYAVYPDDSNQMDNLISYADKAMHEIKRAASSDHIRKFTSDLLVKESTLETEGKIRMALDNDSVFFMLQPQFDMDHNLRGFEALARMRDEDGDIISPAEFIPVAEKAGLIDRVDSVVFKKATFFIGGLIERTGKDIMLSLNVSVRHLMKKDFLEELKGLLETSKIPPRLLEVEITESIMIESMDKAMHCIEEIRNMGIQIAIDDFGTGYSSLSYLNSFPANLLKIDKAFIDQMESGEKSKQYVAAIISLGHIMGFDVISEGVEDEGQIGTLKEIGCDYIQGYVWGKPLPEPEAAKLVTG